MALATVNSIIERVYAEKVVGKISHCGYAEMKMT
jgi:hypothetical protein